MGRPVTKFIPLMNITGTFRDTLTTESGTLTSPNYPQKYPPLTMCFWSITVPRGKRITINFDEVELESHPTCEFDSLEIV